MCHNAYFCDIRYKENNYRLHKLSCAMKKIIFAALVLLSIAPAGAQMTEQLTATLRQGDNTTVFYGKDAFKSAYEAAESGAEITLSSGAFNNPGRIITSNISIYCQGYLNDETTGIAKTSVLDDFLIGTAEAEAEPTENIYMEGIWMNGSLYLSENGVKNIQVVKCRTGNAQFFADAENVVFRQMYFTGSIHARGFTIAGLLVQNSYLPNGFQKFSSSSSVMADHCCVFIRDYYNDRSAVTMSNCITWGANSCVGSVFYNCSLEEGELADRTYVNCYNGVSAGSLFSDQENINWDDARTWELKDPTTYMGNDGTQIGMLGGQYPFEKIPGVPRIIKSEVDGATNAEGQLHLNIQAEARPVNE